MSSTAVPAATSAASMLPPKMEAVTINGYGPYNQVFVRHGGMACGPACEFAEEKRELIDVPALADDARGSKQIIVQNYYTSVNPVDYKLRAGYLSLFVHPKTWQQGVILGQESSGRVVAVGKDVTRFRVGDEVMGMNNGKLDQYGRGTYAEYSLFNEDELAAKPKEMQHYVATTLPTAALASYQALVDEAKLTVVASLAGDAAKQQEASQAPASGGKKRVLILGASGGVGAFMVQFSKKMLDAEVYAVCSSSNAAFVKLLGADYVIAHDKPALGQQAAAGEQENEVAFEDQIPDVDVVMDLVGRVDWRKRVWKLLKNRKDTQYVCLAAADEEFSAWDFLSLGTFMTVRKCLAKLGFGPRYHLLTVKPDGKRLEQLAQWHVQHNFKTCIFRCFQGLQYVPLAHKLLEDKSLHHRGRAIIAVAKNLPFATPTQTFIHQYRDDAQKK